MRWCAVFSDDELELLEELTQVFHDNRAEASWEFNLCESILAKIDEHLNGKD
jgi:hypothetical protein